MTASTFLSLLGLDDQSFLGLQKTQEHEHSNYLDTLASISSIVELKELVLRIDPCGLKDGCKQAVFADGNPRADVMFIGEAPGAEEDERGIPFCGQSGMLLRSIMKAIGLDNSNSYITNMVLWRPPANRTPSEEEIQACMPILEKHISLVNPKVLMLVGSVAARLLKSKLTISALRGSEHYFMSDYLDKPITAIATYHPSYLLRQPGRKAEAWADFLKLAELIKVV